MADGAVREARFLQIGQGMPVRRVGGIHVGNDLRHLGNRNETALGITVAVETPRHVHLHGLVRHRHLVDMPMTGHARDPARDMDAVIEIDVVRNRRHLLPSDGDIPLRAPPDRFEHRCAGPELGMTGHAGFCRRHAGIGRLLHPGVAVTTIDAEVTRVVLVAEGHRLLGGDSHGLPRRPLPEPGRDTKADEKEQTANHDQGPENMIVYGTKNETG